MIKIVRNDAGNCINFVGSSNPAYWNACLSAQVNAANANNVDIKNDIRTVNVNEPIYEFFNVPYTDFGDKDGNAFSNVTECVEYINTQANVSGNTGRFILDATDTLDFSIDDTNTTVLLDNGDNYPVNSITAQENSDGHIDIVAHAGSIIIYKDLRVANTTIDNVAVTQTLATAVNELNALFSQTGTSSGGVAPVITSSLAVSLTYGTTLNYTATATNGVAYEWTNLPSGITTVDGNSRKIIGGSNLSSGTYNITLRAINYFGYDEETIVLTVSAPAYTDAYSLYTGSSGYLVKTNINTSTEFSGINKATANATGNAWSFGGWFKPSTDASSPQFIFSLNQSNNWNNPYCYLQWLGNGSSGKSLKAVIGMSSGSMGEYTKETSSGTVEYGGGLGGWYHIMVTGTGTYTTSGANDGIKIYINGALATTTTSATTNGSGSQGFVGAITINHVRMGQNQVGSRQLEDCNLDEWAWWNTELDATDVSDIYNSGTTWDLMTGTYSPDHFYRMGDGDTYPTVTDNAGSCDLTMTNMTAASFVSDVP